MSKLKLSPEFLREIRELAACWGKTAAARASAELGRDAPLDFQDIERIAAVVAAGMTEGTVTALLNTQAQQLATEYPCPQCQTRCRVEYRDRPLTLDTGGVVQLHEPICHCPQCRRDFFPPADGVASRRAPVQPGRSEEGG
jgi:hypothetical protein